MAKIFPIDYEEKNSIAPGDFVLFSDAEDGDKIKKAQYSNLKGEKGDPGTAATVTVGSTTTGAAGTNASVVNAGTSSAAVLNFTIPKGDKGSQGETGETGPAGNGIASITSSKAGKTTTVTITETNTNSYSFNIEDGADGQGEGDVTGPASSTNGSLVLFDGNTGKIIKQGGTIVDNLTTNSSTDALSAAQGKALKDALDNISGLGKFLSLWDSTTGLPISFPLSTPYTYTTGDYFLVETISTANPPVNYKPNGSSYTGSASSTTESEELEVGDIYIYDGTTWLLQLNHGKTVSFSEIAGSPSDNTALGNALADKQDALTLPATPTQGHLVTWGADNETFQDGGAIPAGDIKQFAYPSVNDDITSLHTWLFQGNTPTRKGAILTSGGGNYTDYYVVVHCLRDTFSDGGEIYAEKTTSSGTTYVKIDYSMPDTTATVTSITTSTGSFFAPGGTATTGYVVTKTAGGYEWAAPSGGIQLAPNTELNIKYHWYGSQASYDSLNQYYTDTANDTAYFTV